MQLTNLNIFSIIIFIAIIWIIVYLWYKKYLIQNKFNKNYKLLAIKKNFFTKYIFLFVSIFILSFTIFGIHYWEKKTKTESNWIDIMFVLDVSKSMNVADLTDSNYKYKRLDLVKQAIANFVTKHKNDRVGLTIFAWDAIWVVPLTLDHNVFLSILKWVDYRNLTKQWSDFNKALLLWVNSLQVWKDRSKALIFISDWWDNDDKVDSDFLKKLRENNKNISFFVVWVWTTKWWRIIKNIDPFWRTIYQKYKWNYVISRLNRDNLEKIADFLWAKYIEIKSAYDLSKLDSFLNNLEKKVLQKNVSWELADFSRNLAILSFIFFIIFLVIYIKE